MSVEKGNKLIALHKAIGNIFDAPENSVIVHACNCQGEWGAGMALAVKTRYPGAFEVYREYCNELKNYGKEHLLRGDAILIPCRNKDGILHYIGCLFTSNRYGRYKDTPSYILRNTRLSMQVLCYKISEINSSSGISEIRMCKINSNFFGVPWPHTELLLKSLPNLFSNDIYNINILDMV